MSLIGMSSWILLSLIDLVRAQSLPDPRRCVAGSGVTGFSACAYVNSRFNTCSSYAAVSSAREYFECYCAQTYFNALFECDSEERLCLGTGENVDSHLSQQVAVWHSGCDSILAYTPTTPVISSITASFSIGYCDTVKLNCQSLTLERDSCTEPYTGGDQASLTSCLCKPPLLSLAFDCSVLGNVSCIQVPAALTQMAEYGHCSNLDQILTLPPSLTEPLGSGTTIRATYYTPNSSTHLIASVTPGPSITVGPTPTQSRASRHKGMLSGAMVFAFWFLFTLFDG